MVLLRRIIWFVGTMVLLGSVLFVPYRASLTVLDPRLANDTTKLSRYSSTAIKEMIAQQAQGVRSVSPQIEAPINNSGADSTAEGESSLQTPKFIIRELYANRLVWAFISNDPQPDYTPPRGCGMMYDAQHDIQLHSSMLIGEIVGIATLLIVLDRSLWKKISRRIVARMNRPSPPKPDRSQSALNEQQIPLIFTIRPPAGLIKRLVAGLIDMLFLLSFAMTATIIWIAFAKPTIPARLETLIEANKYFVGLCALFFIVMDSFGDRGSPGKFMLRIATADMYGYRPNILQIFIRTIGKIMTILPPLVLVEYLVVILVSGLSPIVMKEYGHEVFQASDPSMGIEKSGLLLPLVAVLSLPFFIMVLSPTYQTWYDKLARTLVIAKETKKNLALIAVDDIIANAANPVFMNFLIKAQEFFSKGRYAEAIETFKKALKEDAQSYDALYGLAGAYLAAKNFEESIATYKDVLKVDPADSRAQFGLGMALRQGGREKDAWRLQAELAQSDKAEGQRLHDYLTNYRD